MPRKRPGYGVGAGTNFVSGGTTYEPGVRPSPKPETVEPPYLSFDPAIEAQRREAKRGLEDTEADVTTKQHFATTDLHQALRKIHRDTVRSRQDINRSATRAERKLGYQEADTQTNARRRQEDFNSALSNIARNFGQLGHRQAEAASAGGVLDQGTLAAGGAARAQNQALAEAPIHTAQGRAGEDLTTALGRIGTARTEAATDQQTGLARLKQNRDFEREGAKRTTGRETFKDKREEERARREYQNKNIDLLAEEVYAARQERPGAFAAWAKQHPEAMQKVRAQHGEPPKKKRKGGK